MDMLGRRFLLLVAVLMGVTALAASVAPREPVVREDGRSTPTPTPTAPAATAATGIREPVEQTISASEAPSRVTVDKGDLVELTITGGEADTVLLRDEIQHLDADSPAVFSVFADRAGEFPIALLQAEREIGTLVVRPAS